MLYRIGNRSAFAFVGTTLLAGAAIGSAATTALNMSVGAGAVFGACIAFGLAVAVVLRDSIPP